MAFLSLDGGEEVGGLRNVYGGDFLDVLKWEGEHF